MSGWAAISKEMLLHLGRIQLLHLIKIDTLADGEGLALFFQKLLFGLLQTQRSTPDPFAWVLFKGSCLTNHFVPVEASVPRHNLVSVWCYWFM